MTDSDSGHRPQMAPRGDGMLGLAFAGIAHFFAAPAATVVAVLAAGGVLGAIGDALLFEPGDVALNMSLWVAAVAVAAVLLQRRTGRPLERERTVWLVLGVLFACVLTWREASALKLLSLGSATLAFAIAAYRPQAAWVRRSGVVRYAVALGLGALHAWTATVLAIVDAVRSAGATRKTDESGRRRVSGVARGLAIAAPLLFIFGALFASADAVFAELVGRIFRFDLDRIVGRVVLFAILAWISTGYLRGFLTGTALPSWADDVDEPRPAWRLLGITEVTTAMAAVDLLFLIFVVVQARYLFGADALVQVTPNLTYADYARSGFFELVVAVTLVAPLLLVADWLVDHQVRRDVRLFGALASIQIALVLAIAASALQRLRLYHASYGLTESRLYGMVLLVWISAMLIWLAATVLRGRRQMFAFGALASGLATLAMLCVLNPDALIARTNLERTGSVTATVPFDAAYAASLSADAAPVLIEALPALAPDMQCTIARRFLLRWAPDTTDYLRGWNWSVARARDLVREHETQLRSMVGPDLKCAAPAK